MRAQKPETRNQKPAPVPPLVVVEHPQWEIDQLIERAEYWERLAKQARHCAGELQLKAWL